MILDIVLVIAGLAFLILAMVLILNPPEALVKKYFGIGRRRDSE